MLSQLASSGKVNKMFAHCLDSVNGGGIFAIGQVVQPKVRTTPLVPNQYVMYLRGVFPLMFLFLFLFQYVMYLQGVFSLMKPFFFFSLILFSIAISKFH